MAYTKQSATNKSVYLSSALVSYGFIGLKNDHIQQLNHEVREEFTSQVDRKIHFDNYLQYAPAITIISLRAAGINGKNNFQDQALIVVTSGIIMGGLVNGLKYTTRIRRPDGSARNSFPSGHTAVAFLGAELLHQEYGQLSRWYSFAGYSAAIGTGFGRLYNNRHWLTDVLTGAGIGILSVKAAYWLQPFVKSKIFGHSTDIHGVVIPYYDGSHYGLGMNFTF